jgi:DNA-binding transcriptional LysR family regulator
MAASQIDLAGLALLVDILDAGSLSQAARKLHMTRANVSYRLKQFERQVGYELVRRTTRRMEPTELGRRLHQHGRAIQNEVRAAQDAVDALGQGLHGRVRLSMPTGFGQVVMSGWMIEFKQAYPDISLELLFDNRVDDLLRDEMDLAVRILAEPPEHLVAHALGEVRYVLCASAGHAARQPLPTGLHELAGVPLITASVVGRELRLSAYQGTQRQEVLLQTSIASENFQFLREAILAGLGVGLVPSYLVAEDVAQGRVVTALDDWRLSVFGTGLFLLRMPGRLLTQATRTLIDFLLAKAAQWPAPQAHGRPAKGHPPKIAQ